jgi:deoxycytidylate deaminase
MLKTQRSENKSKLEAQALEIISTDEDERDKPHGQKIIDCYPYADFIIDCSSRASIKKSCRRLVEIFFGQPFISPDEDEYCSYLANAASYRSLDLSRQVGAAIFGSDCEIIAMGCNEVPKSGGGTYWTNDKNDHRDYAIGYDSNQKVREDLTRDVLSRLNESHWISDEFSGLTTDEMVSKMFQRDEEKNGPLVGSMISDIIEYGRMVHAEMNALADAARFRKSTQGATLFCTTMPCHMCAKLIVAAGIKRVVYLQPYGKSLVEELYSDSISLDTDNVAGIVQFETLKGVTPNGFKRAFHKKDKRKNSDGSAKRWNPSDGVPNFLSTFPYYVPLELLAMKKFQEAMSAAKIELTVGS